VAENPVLTLARLLGGVVLMQGRLGHQVLGQLLVTNSDEAALAAAAVVVAGTSRQRNAVAQVALRTAAPVIAASILINKDEKRVERREALLADRERRFRLWQKEVEERDRDVRKREQDLASGQTTLAEERRDLQARLSSLSQAVAPPVPNTPSVGAGTIVTGQPNKRRRVTKTAPKPPAKRRPKR
jgi:uncharacterized protein YlxW (UPF0749 family)